MTVDAIFFPELAAKPTILPAFSLMKFVTDVSEFWENVIKLS